MTHDAGPENYSNAPTGWELPTSAPLSGETTAESRIARDRSTSNLLESVTAPAPRKRLLITLLVSYVVLLGLTITAVALRSAYYGADDTVREYFQAVAARDGERAAAQLDGTLDHQSDPLLQPDVLAEDSFVVPFLKSLEQVTDTDVRAEVNATYEVGTRTVQQSFLLVRAPARPWRFLRKWRISGGLATLDVTWPYYDRVRVTGHSYPVDEVVGSFSSAAFPGGYPIEDDSNDPLFTSEEVLAVPGEPAAPNPQIKPAVRKKIDTTIGDYLSTCEKEKTLAPDNCPFSTSSYGSVSHVSWRVKDPEYTLSPQPGVIALETTTPGRASVRYTWDDDYPSPSRHEDSVEFELNYSITFADGDLQYSSGS